MMKKNNIHQTAIIYDDVTIGENVFIGPYCIIGAPAEMKNDFFNHIGKGVIIHDNSVITGHCTIDAGYKEPTIIGKDCFLMKHTHIGHDTVIDNDVTISVGVVICGHVKLCEYTTVGVNATIHQKVTIAPGSMIGMGSVVTKNPIAGPFDTIFGAPAKRIGKNKHLLDKLNAMEILEITSKFNQND